MAGKAGKQSRSHRGGATPATTALTREGIAFAVHTYEHDADDQAFGDEAVAKLAEAGAQAEQVFKTLVLAVQGHGSAGSLAVAVLPVPHQLSLKAAAKALGAHKVELAERAVVERTTGYVFGGVSPVGQRKALPTVIDESARSWASVFVSGGRRGFEIELAPADLAAITDARFAPIAAQG